MSAPNRNTLWARAAAEELYRSGVRSVCLTPGSRNTPLTVAFTEHDGFRVHSLLDERSSAFFGLGRGAVSGRPAAVVTTSGTAAAECHPAVLEADRGRVPLLVLTADRPPELHDSGANQTVDQTGLFGSAVRWFWEAPEPEPYPRKLRALRTAICRAVETSRGSPPGPVHLNLPFRKPLEPTRVPGDVPEDFERDNPLAADGRDPNPFVESRGGSTTLREDEPCSLARRLRETSRGLIHAGPLPPAFQTPSALVALGESTGFPILADPLSGLRFHGEEAGVPILGGYDAYLDGDGTFDLPEPELILRFGAPPTASKTLTRYLERAEARQWIVDPGGGWPEGRFRAETVLRSDPVPLVRTLVEALDPPDDRDWSGPWEDGERRYWNWIEERRGEQGDHLFEGFVWEPLLETLPEGTVLFVGNSLPVRDLLRYGRPRSRSYTVLANRGVSGIDGNLSTAVGAAAEGENPLFVVLGDLALYHDLNALLLPERLDVDTTVLVINNDGGGIFHRLPIRHYDPPFTDYVRTPHGVNFRGAAEQFGLQYHRVESPGALRAALSESSTAPGSHLLEAVTDAGRDEDYRRTLQEELKDLG